MNLKDETLVKFNLYDLSPQDIIFIGSLESGYSCSWDEFLELANIEYDEDYGSAEIMSDLVIIFRDDSKLIRESYDGSEWWAYHAIPVLPINTKPLTTLREYPEDY